MPAEPSSPASSRRPPVRHRPPVDPRLVRHVRTARGALVASTGVGTAMAVAVVVQAVALADLLGRAFGHPGAPTATVPIVVLAAAVAARAGLAWIGEVIASTAAGRVRRELRDSLVAQVLGHGPAWLAERRRGEVAALLTTGVDALDEYFGRYVPELVLAVVAPGVVLAWVVSTDWLSAAILAGTAVLVPLFMALLGSEAEVRMRRRWTETARLAGHFLDVVRGLVTLRLFGRTRAQRRTIAEVTERHREATMDTLRFAFLSAFTLELLSSLATALVALTLGLRLVAGRMDLTVALGVLLVTPEVYLPLRRASARFHAAAEGVGASAQILDVMEAPSGTDRATPGSSSGGAARLVADLAAGRVPEIVFEGVEVRYPGRATPALAPLDLRIDPEEHVALAGPTGAGKSTVLAVLLRLVTPSAGRVLVDGVDLATVDPGIWRAHLGWLPQEPTILSATVADNLRLAAPGASRRGLLCALEEAGAAEFVSALPRGLDSRLGEGGAGLSAGQRQRLALARCVLRPGQVLLVDEPTSHLDRATEAVAVALLGRLAAGRTVVAVSHREAVSDAASRIVRIAAPSAVLVSTSIGGSGAA